LNVHKGVIRKRGRPEAIGRWQADARAIVVETEDLELRKAADEILATPLRIPVHAPDRHAGLSLSVDIIEAPATAKYLALFALELEARGFEVEPDEEEG
jgi:hypothetical protein